MLIFPVRPDFLIIPEQAFCNCSVQPPGKTCVRSVTLMHIHDSRVLKLWLQKRPQRCQSELVACFGTLIVTEMKSEPGAEDI